MKNSRSSLLRLSALAVLALGLAMGGCVSLAVGTAVTAVKVGTSVVGIGVSVGKTIVKTGGAVVIDLAVP
jgi:hypothetical protein